MSDDKAEFGETDDERQKVDWEIFKKKVDTKLANGDVIHAMFLFAGFTDGGGDKGATVTVAGCPICITTMLKVMQNYKCRVEEDGHQGHLH